MSLENAKLELTKYGVTKIQLFTAGYSEGGAYSIWFSKCISNYSQCPYITDKRLDLTFYQPTAFAGLDGAYDLVNVVKPFLMEDANKERENKFEISHQYMTNLVKPGLASVTLLSYSYYARGAAPFN